MTKVKALSLRRMASRAGKVQLRRVDSVQLVVLPRASRAWRAASAGGRPWRSKWSCLSAIVVEVLI